MMSDVSTREADFFDRHWHQTPIGAIQGRLTIPEVHNLENTKILICSCGSGREPVLAANAGAKVFAFDISSKAVTQALAVARYNGKDIRADVMDFHSLTYPSNSFDVIYGSYVLHHVDCEQAAKEIYRCLKPDGIGFFWENSDRNPILRYARRLMFGSPGGHQRSRFLFFSREGTSDEYPLTEDETQMLAAAFDGHMKRIYVEFFFFQLLADHGWRDERFKNVMRYVDNLIGRLFPAVMKYSFLQGILLQKKQRE